MNINLEILDAAYLYNKTSIEELQTKELVPNMMFRRRLTRSSKLIIELMHKVNFSEGRILYGTSFGELKSTANILNAILNKDMISPTDFQNSVYNTAVSYASILKKNKNEIMTISSGDETSLKVLKAGAIKALDGDEILLICSECLNIPNIEDINKCDYYLESAVALKVKLTNSIETLHFNKLNDTSIPKSISHIFTIAKEFKKKSKIIVKIEI